MAYIQKFGIGKIFNISYAQAAFILLKLMLH